MSTFTHTLAFVSHQGQQWVEWWDLLSELRLREWKTSPRALHWTLLPLANAALHLSLWVILGFRFSHILIPELLEGFTTQAPTVRPPVVGVGAVVIMSTSTLGAEVEE